MNIEVANRLAELRKKSGLSQEQLAEQLGISRQAISKWERAESSPDTDNLIALARLYGVSLDALVNMSDEAEADERFAHFQQVKAESEQEGGVVEEIQETDDCRSVKRTNPDGSWTWTFDHKFEQNLYAFPYPVIVVALYLMLSFFLNLWHPGWLLFLTIPIYYTAIDGDHFDLNRVPFPLLVVPMYAIMGAAWNWWHPGWLIFLTIPIYYTVMHNRIQSGLNLLLMSVMLLAVFSMLGWAMGSWVRWLLSGVGAVAVGVAVLSMQKRT